jgi:hypothetical protein
VETLWPNKILLGAIFCLLFLARDSDDADNVLCVIWGYNTRDCRSTRAIRSSRGGVDAAREVADRIWGMMLGVVLALVQWFALPLITRWFSLLTTGRDAVRGPAAILSFIHLVNELVFAGEGTMLELGSYRDLALITCLGVFVMVLCLSLSLGYIEQGAYFTGGIQCCTGLGGGGAPR